LNDLDDSDKKFIFSCGLGISTEIDIIIRKYVDSFNF